MYTTDKNSCVVLVELLKSHGVRHVVVSPGSRNAPIVVALSSCDDMEKIVVVDERSAAFVALGIASQSGEMVALVCTSGTAVLNYAPAIAEAYYRKLPLIVISADRPMEWIDQDDSQTLRQYEALSHYVKGNYNIPAPCDDETARWYVNRVVNDALLAAKSGRRAPVHINIQLDEPLNGRGPVDGSSYIRVIDKLSPCEALSESDAVRLSRELVETKKVLIIAGFNAPNQRLCGALQRLAKESNVVVMTETIANLHSKLFIESIDRVLSVLDDDQKHNLCPDLVITLGGAIVSRFVKQYLRQQPIKKHWHVGITDTTIDCFKALTLRIDMEPEAFFTQLADGLSECGVNSNYAHQWKNVELYASQLHNRYVDSVQWSDLKAFATILPRIPQDWNLQLSNGTSIRYAQLFASSHIRRCDCNRGVSGIDGCTSTAIGASVVYDGTTLLISGDMSAQYDVGALACRAITSRFKMIVICNGGGGIFRFIKSTSQLPELENYFAVPSELPLRQLADGYGFAYYEARNQHELIAQFDAFAAEQDNPAIMAIYTPAQESADILTGYFERHKSSDN